MRYEAAGEQVKVSASRLTMACFARNLVLNISQAALKDLGSSSVSRIKGAGGSQVRLLVAPKAQVVSQPSFYQHGANLTEHRR